jgi:hypothetical protein
MLCTIVPFGPKVISLKYEIRSVARRRSLLKINMAKALSMTVFFFTALTLAHAGFIDYRSGVSESQRDKQLNQMQYLQTRKFGVESPLTFGREIWRGMTRQRWTEKCLCCGVFELLVSTRGGPTRVRMLRLLVSPKNKLQLSKDLGIDWKAIDRRVDRMLKFGLVQVVDTAGTSTTFVLSQKGANALSLL